MKNYNEPSGDLPEAKTKLKILTFSIVILIFTFLILDSANAATNVSSIITGRRAWNDVVGWLDFYETNTVMVTSTKLSGYASSSVGYIALNCDSTPNGDICAGGAGAWKVSNDGGNLSGWAWNDAIGWISFDSTTATSTYAYQVTVNVSTGDFSGWAWNDIVGWFSFNCNNSVIGNTCGTSNYKVNADWFNAPQTAELTSSIFDTGVSTGVAINTIMWQGNKPAGTIVQFQIASVNSLGGGGAGSIDSTYRYAWADSIGWIDFGYSAGNVTVGETQLTGYAYNDDVLQIALDCATTPIGNICESQSNFKVNRNSTTGDLSGWAWNDNIGWISFCGNASGGSTWDGSKWVCPASPTYQVKVNPTTGAFTGWAWNDYVGWISVNCADPDLCDSSDYRVNTALTATWTYRGPNGQSGTYYTPSDANVPIMINLQYHNNHRYFRYKIFLETDSGQTASPRVDDVIINYSPQLQKRKYADRHAELRGKIRVNPLLKNFYPRQSASKYRICQQKKEKNYYMKI